MSLGATYRGQHKHRRITMATHPCLEWDANQRSQSSTVGSYFVSQTERPLRVDYRYEFLEKLNRLDEGKLLAGFAP